MSTIHKGDERFARDVARKVLADRDAADAALRHELRSLATALQTQITRARDREAEMQAALGTIKKGLAQALAILEDRS